MEISKTVFTPFEDLPTCKIEAVNQTFNSSMALFKKFQKKKKEKKRKSIDNFETAHEICNFQLGV